MVAWRVFPKGLGGLLLALPIAVFSFGGIEVLGLTAGETANPDKSLPKAFNGIVYRIFIFYIGALTVIMTLYPWDQLDPRPARSFWYSPAPAYRPPPP